MTLSSLPFPPVPLMSSPNPILLHQQILTPLLITLPITIHLHLHPHPTPIPTAYQCTLRRAP